jgi:hypothetical protein
VKNSVISTWFVADGQGEETAFPQIGELSSSTLQFQNIYWQCICVFFASSIRFNPQRQHVLFTNAAAPKIGDFDVNSFLKATGVATVQLPVTYRLPKGVFSSFGNQFYILDILKYAAQSGFDSPLFVFDSDCVWIRSAEQMELALDSADALTYDLGYAAEHCENGLTGSAMAQIAQNCGTPCGGDFIRYFGGEAFGATPIAIRNLAGRIDHLWDENLRLIRDGSPNINEEAQFLSILYSHLGYTAGTFNPYIKRIWTTFHHSTANSHDLKLLLWHLPSEKRTGLTDLFQDMRMPNSSFWRLPVGEPFRGYVARKVGIPSRSPSKYIRDMSFKFSERLRQFRRGRSPNNCLPQAPSTTSIPGTRPDLPCGS